jgi:hypothetical protein
VLWLHEVGESTRQASVRLQDLVNEAQTHQSLLENLEKTLKECKPLTMQHMDEHLWSRMNATIEDCEKTISLLETRLKNIRESSTSRFRLFPGLRPNIQIKLTWHADEIAGFRDKIHKSNFALQTALHMVNMLVNYPCLSFAEVLLGSWR